MHWPITVASFRTWRGSQDYIARDPAPDISILTFESADNRRIAPELGTDFELLDSNRAGVPPGRNEACKGPGSSPLCVH
jgi:hypothetical protein